MVEIIILKILKGARCWLLLACMALVPSCEGIDSNANDVCMEACEKVHQCSNSPGTVMGCTFTQTECSGINKCITECVVNASCEELLKMPGEGLEGTEYSHCTRSCLGLPVDAMVSGH